MTDYKLLSELSTLAASFAEVAEVFALTPEQVKDPQAGKWIVDRIKQMQTAYTIREQLTKRVDFPKAQNAGLPEENVVNK